MDTQQDPAHGAANPYSPPIEDGSQRPMPSPQVHVASRAAPYRDNSGRTRVLAVAIVLFMLALIAQLVGIYDLRAFFERAIAGTATQAEGLAVDARNAALHGLRLVVFIVSAIAWCFWLHRAYTNCWRLSGIRPLRTPGYAVGCHFIPFVNLAAPWVVMSELWRCSTPTDPMRPRGTPLLIHFWWFTWIGSGVASWIYGVAADTPSTPAEGLSYADGMLAVSALPVLASIFALILVLRVNRRQVARHDEMVTAAPA